jgi:AhpD family alkylhydroperoxidase
MFSDIDEIRSLRKKYNYKMFTSGVSTFREFEELEAKTLQSGALDRKYKELISLALSMVTLCYGCIEYHTTSAVECGATRQEIAETVAVALMLGGGGRAQWTGRYVFKVLDDLEQQKKEASQSTDSEEPKDGATGPG